METTWAAVRPVPSGRIKKPEPKAIVDKESLPRIRNTDGSTFSQTSAVDKGGVWSRRTGARHPRIAGRIESLERYLEKPILCV